MLLATGNSWAMQHQWLLPVFEFGAVVFGICAVVTTRWFRRATGIVPRSESAEVRQSTRGNNSSNVSVGAVGTLNVTSGPALVPKTRTAERRVSRVLEAATQSLFYVGKVGRITAIVSLPNSLGLRRELQSRGWTTSWGEIKQSACKIPFRDHAGDSFIYTLHLETPGAESPEQRKNIHLEEAKDSLAVNFFVTPRTAGVHQAELQLVVDTTVLGTTFLEVATAGDVDSHTAHGGPQVLVTVKVEYRAVGPKYSQENKQGYEQGYEQKQAKKKGINKGLGFGV
jgi:hypothetical protein